MESKENKSQEKKARPKWLQDLPNHLSLFRIATVPILLILYPLALKFEYFPLKIFCSGLFALSAMTDWLDGFLARQFNLESKLGATLDPIADKVLTGTALILITYSHALWPWMTGALLVREMALSGLRLVSKEMGLSIKVSIAAKWKTLFLGVALTCLLVDHPLFGWPFQEVGFAASWLSLSFSYYSAYLYFRDFWERADL